MVKDQKFYGIKKRRLILTALIAFIAFFVFVPLLTYYYFAPDLVSKEAIMNRNDSGVVLTDRKGRPFFSFYQAKFKSFIPLSEISQDMHHAVIAIEDKDFYNHPGFSIRAITRSFLANLMNKDITQGGSTITQQLIKNSLLTPKRSYFRKFQEVLLAQEIERRFTKNEILEMYLNSVYFGEGAFGVNEAAEVYFNKDAKDLSVAEAAMLAGILPSPSRYSPLNGNREAALTRQRLVLQRMYEQKYITKEEYDKAKTQKLTYNTTRDSINSIAPHFALMVIEQLKETYGEEEVTRSGFKVKTTLDLDWQEYAEGVVKDQVAKLAVNKVTNGAAVVMDPKSGEIRALVGSRNWYDETNGKFNMAVSPRQPGSSFKPVVYSLALDKKIITPASIVTDTPKSFEGGYRPLNYDRKSRGQVTVRRALSNSLNIPSVEIMSKVGVQEVLDYSKNIGISTLSDASNYGLSLVLGTGEVPLVEMTNVYAMFANYGIQYDPTTILEIQDKQNDTIYSYSPDPKQVLDSRVAFLISSILSDNNTRAETFGNVLTISRQAAVKTGTTEDYVDAWTLGYTPNLAVGVWVGNNDHKPMDNIAGSLGAAPIWKLLMEHYITILPQESFEAPDGIVQANCTVIKKTENKDENKDKEEDKDKKEESISVMEYFVAGTEPSSCRAGNAPTPATSITPSVSVSPSPTPENTSPTPTPNQSSPTPTTAPTAAPSPTPVITVQVEPTKKDNGNNENNGGWR